MTIELVGVKSEPSKIVEHNQFYALRREAIVHHMAVLMMVVAAFYSVVNLVLQANIQPVLTVGTFLGGVATYWLNKLRFARAAKITGLVVANTIIFIAATSESHETSIYLYFGATGLIALFIFGYEERWMGLLFVAIPAALYVLTRFSSWQVLPYRDFPHDLVQMFFVVNVCTFTYVSAYLVMVMLRTNYQSEKVLRESNEKISEQNAKLIKANAELDRFMYTTSHDLRAPLSSLRGLVRLTELSNEVSEVKEYAQMMNGSINSLEKFTHAITDHYRNSKTSLDVDRINLKEFVDGILSDLAHVSGSGKIKFISNLSKHVIVETDPMRLRLVLSNLISNAIKYQRPEESDQFVKIFFEKNGEVDCITIEDNGRGIRPEHIGRIFDMFYRASEFSEGSGLGLYIVKETLAKLDGTIEVTSRPGNGSSFQVRLRPRIGHLA